MSLELRNEKKISKNCVHTKQVYSLIDIPKKEEVYKRLAKHLESCESCSFELEKFKLETTATKVFIPKIAMARDLKESFDREVGELFKVMEINEHEALKRNVKKGFKFFDNMGLDFFKNLKSKSMVKAYLFALVLFFSLKYFL